MPPPDGEGGQSWGWAQKRSKNLDGSLLLQHGSDKAPRLQRRWTNSIVMSLRQPAGSSSELLNGVEVESRDALEVADVADYGVPRSAIPRLGPAPPQICQSCPEIPLINLIPTPRQSDLSSHPLDGDHDRRATTVATRQNASGPPLLAL